MSRTIRGTERQVSPPEIRFFRDRQGRNIAYSRLGEGPLVICPAWWVSHVEKDWSHVRFRDFFTRLGEGLTLVRYDRPGVGLSDASLGTPSLESEAALLADLIAELGAERYSFLAMSCGAPTAIVEAVRRPAAVERICFYGAYAQGQAICPAEVQNAVISAVKAHWGMGSRAIADIFFPDADRETLDGFARQQRESASVEAAAELLCLTYAMDARALLPQVQAESLILHRRQDRAIPFAAARELAAGIRGARLVTLEGRAHPPWLGGGEIARLANAFLRGHEVAAEAGRGEPFDTCRLDDDNRCLVIEGEEVGLTPLEFALMRELTAAPKRVVTRDELLERVWRQPFEGSNRIDSLVRGLRRKLGPYAASVETVIGHGYRFIGWTKQG